MFQVFAHTILLVALGIAWAQEAEVSTNDDVYYPLEMHSLEVNFSGELIPKKILQGLAQQISASHLSGKGLPITPKSPAPVVSRVVIFAVESTQGGQEILDDGASTTVNDHGGDTFIAYTYVRGYGGVYDRATFNGNTATLIARTPYDEDGNSIVDGFVEKWDISRPPNGSGTFIFIAYSVNPGPTLSTSLYIR